MISARFRRWLATTTALGASAWMMACAGAFPTATAASAHAGKPGTPSSADNTPPSGIDIRKLDDFERKVFFRIVNSEASACGKGHSLIYSAKHDTSCRASFYAVRYVARLVDSGFTDSEISERLDMRFRAPRVPHFALASAPSKGGASARVTLIEFVDYECPHCKHAQDLVRQAMEEYPNEIKVYFKHFPLMGHTNARLAAEGAVAANKQGKFWAYNDRVWQNMENLTPAVLEKAAKGAGLDVARWRKDMGSAAAKDLVQADKSEGANLGITGTPAIFINGRRYGDPLEIVSLKDWIDEALGR